MVGSRNGKNAARAEQELSAIFQRQGMPASLAAKLGAALVIALVADNYSAILSRLAALEEHAETHHMDAERLEVLEAQVRKLQLAVARVEGEA